jgi:hypothetical protein
MHDPSLRRLFCIHPTEDLSALSVLHNVVGVPVAGNLSVIAGAALRATTVLDNTARLIVTAAVGKVVCGAVEVEIDIAGAISEPAQSDALRASGLAFNPDNPVVGLVAILELLAIANRYGSWNGRRNRCRSRKDSREERKCKEDALELHFVGDRGDSARERNN